MGCDIHLHVEIKVKGEWRHYNHPGIAGRYDLFAKMANVRNCRGGIEPISPPRGLPENVAFITKLDADRLGADGHSYSYLDSTEILELQEWSANQEWAGVFWFAQTFGFLFGNSLGGFAKYPDERPGFLEDVRFVFWFDG